MAKPKFAIVGTGNMAATMVSAFAGADVPIAAVVSRDEQRASAFARAFGIPLGTSNLQDVLARQDIDAVYVANMPTQHAATVIAALRAGKAVLCEKPMATNQADLTEIVQAAARSRVLCMEGLWTLCLPAYRQFLDTAISNRVGEPRSLVASFAYPTNDADLPTLQAAERGGVLLDRGVYLIALALTVFGNVTKVDAQITHSPSGIETEAFILLKHQSGARSQLATAFTSCMSNTATLNCSRGLITLKEPLIGSEAVITKVTPPGGLSGDALSAKTFASTVKEWLRQSPQIRMLKQMANRSHTRRAVFGRSEYIPQLQHFLAMLNAGRTESDIVPLSLSSGIMAVIEQARQASGPRI